MGVVNMRECYICHGTGFYKVGAVGTYQGETIVCICNTEYSPDTRTRDYEETESEAMREQTEDNSG